MSENYKGSSEKLVNSKYLFNQLTALFSQINSKIPTSLPAEGGNADTANKWTTARNITIGEVTKSIDGSENITWGLSEIGIVSNIDFQNHCDNTANKHSVATITNDGFMSADHVKDLDYLKTSSVLMSNPRVISCKIYGCVGDGVTDDTQSLQNAINDIGVNGGLLYLEKGTYKITDRLFIEKPTNILGASISETTLKFELSHVNITTTPYDDTWWEESDSAICIKANNVTMQNFTILGGDSTNKSLFNGIIMHYPKNNGEKDYYSASERIQLNHIIVKGFRNGLYVYAGWNRYIYCCSFIDNSDSGIKYYPLELSTVGNWSASGDVIVACQFVGNGVAGYWARSNLESTVWNCMFEYNERAIYTYGCKDVCFKNCWNEANYNNILIEGSIKFEGGYNITSETVNHNLLGNDFIQFENENSVKWIRGNEIIFNQENGIITKGVNLGSEIENLLLNSYFRELSQGTSYVTSTANWNGWNERWSISTDVTYSSNNYHTACYNFTSSSGNPAYTIYQEVDCTTNTYTFEFKAQTPDRSAVDNGIIVKIYPMNVDGTIINTSMVRTYTFVGDNVWEDFSYTVTLPETTVKCRVEVGVVNNGVVYFAIPNFYLADGLQRSDVYFRHSTTNPKELNVINSEGNLIGTLTLN